MFGFDLDGKLGNFIRIMGMTCSYQESINHTKPSDLQKAKSECSWRENCTAVRTNTCDPYGSTGSRHDFCVDDPVRRDQITTAIPLETPKMCIYKKRDPDGMFVFVMLTYKLNFLTLVNVDQEILFDV